VSRPVLLDVNVLVALFDPDHIHHEVAHDWFAENRHRGWATCPVTENGFLRVLTHPAYGSPVASVSDLVERLRAFCGTEGHLFWPDGVSLRDENVFDTAAAISHRQLTDIYLVGVALAHRGALATFDRSIPLRAVVGARRDLLEVIAPAT
jgi:toxin-antitoxin system PIN domain toxin